ncbi:MAG: hypothetical protein M1556_00680 [Candidatus Thermoplasmatota archaeon]|nr:hypothetical protein [Candidatus Thermoplasmatota archaeon]MCL6002153.1 hypothetical protein [Candidatus Thermoplasmatota archaeon]
MRFLAWHVGQFLAVPTEKGRSPIVEEARTVEADNAILVFANFEKGDEPHQTEIVTKAANEIASVAANLKVTSIVLNPFVHLFGEPSTPESAVSMLKMLDESLTARGLQVQRLAFGMFYELELKAKGHRFSRIARKIE